MGETISPPDKSWFLRSLDVPLRRGSPVSAAGKHRAAPDRSRWRRSSAQAVIPALRRVGVELVDADTQVAHRVDPELLAGALSGGRAATLCGA